MCFSHTDMLVCVPVPARTQVLRFYMSAYICTGSFEVHTGPLDVLFAFMCTSHNDTGMYTGYSDTLTCTPKEVGGDVPLVRADNFVMLKLLVLCFTFLL